MNERNGCCTEDPGKRQAILEQAIHTFAKLGFRGTDVQVIADRAGVGKGTVYRYFRSKEDLFWATTYEVLLRMETHIFRAMDAATGAAAKLREAALAYSRFFTDNPHYFELFLQDLAEFRGTGPASHREHHEKLVARVENILAEGIRLGELRPIDTRQTTLAFGSLCFGANVLGRRLQPISATNISEYAIDLFLRGIVAESSCEASRARTYA